MFEACINASQQNSYYIKYIDERLSASIDKLKGLSAMTGKGNRCYYSVACEDAYCDQLTDILVDKIADVILLGYKNSYFRDNLNIRYDSFLSNTLVNIMCIFDHTADKVSIKNTIGDISNFSIEGYCNFRMKQVKSKWDEIILLTNTYEQVLLDDRILREFIAFLVNAIPIRESQMSVFLENGDFLLLNAEGEQLAPLDIVYPHQSMQEQLMLNLVCHKSKHIYMVGEYYNAVGEDFEKLADILFNITVIKPSIKQ
ncbi:MAG: hypothetical protein PHW00_05685 [Clostridia bacterium]|nr:hypothetical protein [Clostridia bacterium]